MPNHAILEITPANIFTMVILLGSVAHLMIFMNGYWNDLLWFSAIITLGIPILIQKYLNSVKRQKRQRKKIQEI